MQAFVKLYFIDNWLYSGHGHIPMLGLSLEPFKSAILFAQRHVQYIHRSWWLPDLKDIAF
jgi:hypothetical protein